MTAVSGSKRVNRGGSWNNNARNCRASNRNNNSPGNRNNNLGFRLLSTRRRQRARFMERAREPAPCPGGSSRSGKQPDEQRQPAASGRPRGATAAAGNAGNAATRYPPLLLPPHEPQPITGSIVQVLLESQVALQLQLGMRVRGHGGAAGSPCKIVNQVIGPDRQRLGRVPRTGGYVNYQPVGPSARVFRVPPQAYRYPAKYLHLRG